MGKNKYPSKKVSFKEQTNIQVNKAYASIEPVSPYVELILCFCGSFWGNSSKDLNAMEIVLRGAMVTESKQFFGFAEGKIIYIEINDGGDPISGLDNKALVDILLDRLEHTGMPAPIHGHARFYLLVLPPAVECAASFESFEDQCFVYNGATGFYSCVGYDQSRDKETLNRVFSTSLLEAWKDIFLKENRAIGKVKIVE